VSDDPEFDADERWEMWEHPVVWEGEDCTCVHTPGQHGRGRCGVQLGDGAQCPCAAGWME
jgi:hypothetical protein